MSVKEKIINGRKYKCAPFRFTEAAQLGWELGGILSPGVGALTGSMENIDTEDISNSKVDGNSLGDGLQKLFMNLPPEKVIPLMAKLLKNISTEITKPDGNSVMIVFNDDTVQKMDMCFTEEHMMDGFILIPFVLGVNFPPLARVGTSFGSLMNKIGGSNQV